MNPFLFNKRVVVKYPTSSSVDRFGQSIITYASQSMWMEVKPSSGAENNVQGYVVNNATYKFVARQNNDSFNTYITEKSNIIYKGNTYNIVFIDADEKTPRIAYITAERRN
jgi:SPP1 family predicted phage head-tail adaptor